MKNANFNCSSKVALGVTNLDTYQYKRFPWAIGTRLGFVTLLISTFVFYHDLKHPLREPWNTRTTPYEIWKEYHDDIIFDAPYYSILGYFDTRQEAKQFVQQHKLQEV